MCFLFLKSSFSFNVSFDLTWRFLPFAEGFLIIKAEYKLMADPDVDGSLLVEGDQQLGEVQAL